MDKPWFDQETGTLMLDEYVVQMDSYRRIVEDEAITDDELVEQTQRAPEAAGGVPFAGGQSHRHRGVGRVGGAQRPASQAPASCFHATAVRGRL
jgi:hypothetical protein